MPEQERADHYLLLPVPQTGCRQGAAMGTIHRPLWCIQKDEEPSRTSGLQGLKPLSKKHIVKMSTPLPSIPPPIVDEDETLKASAIILPLPTSQDVDDDKTLKAAAIKLPLPSASGEDDGHKEALAAQPTHSMPVSFRHDATVTREAFAVQVIDALPDAPEMHEAQVPNQQPDHPIQGKSVLPTQSIAVRSWMFSRLLLVLVILVPLLLAGGVLEAIQLNQRQEGLYQVNARTGVIQWQQTLPAAEHIARVDALGSLLNVTTGRGLHQIIALNRHNVIVWQTAQSQNTYSLFPDSTSARTVLLALSGHISVSNAVDGNTFTYLNTLIFSLVDRQSGQTLWQKTLVSPQQEQGAAIVGTDTRYIYIALAHIAHTTNTTTQGAQLLALNRLTGQVDWQLTEHNQTNAAPQDAGQLLLWQHLLIWQVAGTLYAIETEKTPAAVPGEVLWHTFIAETNIQLLPQEEAQMAIAGKYLLVERNDAFHALDPSNGRALWEVFNPGLAPAFMTSYNNIVLIYGNGAIEALDSNTQQIMWSQQQLDAIQNLHISDDGTLAYATITDSIESSSPAQALVAIDMKNGSVRWTFQPSAQVTFLPLQASGILYSGGIVLTSFCASLLPALPPTPSTAPEACPQQYLYALNATTGVAIWKYAGSSISDVQISNDGTTVLFQRTSSAWLDLTEHFKNA